MKVKKDFFRLKSFLFRAFIIKNIVNINVLHSKSVKERKKKVENFIINIFLFVSLF